MYKVLYLDHTRCGKDQVAFTFRRFKREIPDIKLFFKRNYEPEILESKYDGYLLHLASLGEKELEILREDNPSALIIGLSDGYVYERETPSHLKHLLDAYSARDTDEETLNRLVQIFKSRIK